MPLVVVTPPAGPALPLADLKARLRLDPAATADDAALTAFAEVAIGALDGPDGWLGQALRPQVLEWSLPGFPAIDVLTLPCPPVAAVLSVTIVAADGTTRVLDPAGYELDGRDLVPVFGTIWPATRRAPGAVRVRYQAGYDTVPAPVVQAIVLAVAAMNTLTRAEALSAETVVGVYSRTWAAGGDQALSAAARVLLGPYRIFDR